MVNDIIKQEVDKREKVMESIHHRLKNGIYKSGNLEAKYTNEGLRLESKKTFNNEIFYTEMNIEAAMELIYFIEHLRNEKG